MKAGTKRVLLIAVIASLVLMWAAGCKEKHSSTQHGSQRSGTTQKQTQKALEDDL